VREDVRTLKDGLKLLELESAVKQGGVEQAARELRPLLARCVRACAELDGWLAEQARLNTGSVGVGLVVAQCCTHTNATNIHQHHTHTRSAGGRTAGLCGRSTVHWPVSQASWAAGCARWQC
jgi:hypothetical protein